MADDKILYEAVKDYLPTNQLELSDDLGGEGLFRAERDFLKVVLKGEPDNITLAKDALIGATHETILSQGGDVTTTVAAAAMVGNFHAEIENYIEQQAAKS